VRSKLDENIPVSVAEPLRSAGHDVDTVVVEGLAGTPDVEVLANATSSDRLVVTLDRGFADLRVHPPGSHAGIIVLRRRPCHLRTSCRRCRASSALSTSTG
jgi:predicted nuclease of predicted toxin-antitoxin system